MTRSFPRTTVVMKLSEYRATGMLRSNTKMSDIFILYRINIITTHMTIINAFSKGENTKNNSIVMNMKIPL